MKNNTRKIFVALLVVLTLLMSVATLTVSAADEATGEENVLYLNPGNNWAEAGAWFSAWFFNGTSADQMVSLSDSNGDGVYEVSIPEGGYKNIIFVRQNPSNTVASWNDIWGQTADLDIPTDGKNCYNVVGWAEASSAWGVYTYVAPTYRVAGVSALCGADWDPTADANLMSLNPETGLYEITYEDVAVGNYAFKVTMNGVWTAWPAQDYKFSLEAISDVTITFDAAAKVVNHVATPTGEVAPETPVDPAPEVPDDGGEGDSELSDVYYLVGWINGADVGIAADAANLGPHKFVNGQCTVEMTGDNYVQVKNDDYVIYGTETFVSSGKSAVLKKDGGEKLMVPAGKVTFTLVENSDGTLTISYTSSSAGGGSSSTPSEPAENPIQPNENGYYQIYVYNTAWWDFVNFYAWDNDLKDSNGDYVNSSPWPGQSVSESTYLLYPVLIEAKWDWIIFNDGKPEGAVQSDDIAILSIDQSKIVYNNATGEWMALEDYDPDKIVEKPEAPATPDHSECEKVRVYLGNAFGWSAPKYYCWTDGASSLAGWPGTEMDFDDAVGLFYADICACFEKVIFNDGNGSQTANLFVPLKGDDKIVCDASLCVGQAGGSELGEGQSPWVKLEDYEIPEPVLPPEFDVQIVVKDTANWGQVYLHYWGGDSESTYPGLPMEQGTDGLYYGIIPAGTIGFQINNGGNWEDGTELKSPDMVVPNDGNNCYDNGTGEWSYVELEGEDDPVVPNEPVNPDDKPVTPDDPAEDEDKNNDGYTREELAEMNFFQKLWAVIVKFFSELFKGFKKN